MWRRPPAPKQTMLAPPTECPSGSLILSAIPKYSRWQQTVTYLASRQPRSEDALSCFIMCYRRYTGPEKLWSRIRRYFFDFLVRTRDNSLGNVLFFPTIGYYYYLLLYFNTRGEVLFRLLYTLVISALGKSYFSTLVNTSSFLFIMDYLLYTLAFR